MKGVFIPNMEKPEACGHHIDKYRSVLSCPMARTNGSCRLLNNPERKRPNFQEQYEKCPLLSMETGQSAGRLTREEKTQVRNFLRGISSLTTKMEKLLVEEMPIREADEPEHVGYTPEQCGREK